MTTYPAATRVGRCSTSATDKRIGTIEIRSYIRVQKWLCTQLLQGFPFPDLKMYPYLIVLTLAAFICLHLQDASDRQQKRLKDEL